MKKKILMIVCFVAILWPSLLLAEGFKMTEYDGPPEKMTFVVAEAIDDSLGKDPSGNRVISISKHTTSEHFFLAFRELHPELNISLDNLSDYIRSLVPKFTIQDREIIMSRIVKTEAGYEIRFDWIRLFHEGELVWVDPNTGVETLAGDCANVIVPKLFCQMQFDSGEIRLGQSATLYWESNAKSAIIGLYGELSSSGEMQIEPGVGETTFQGNFYRGDESITCEASVNVLPAIFFPKPLVPKLVFHIWGESWLSDCCGNDSRSQSEKLLQAEKEGSICRWIGTIELIVRFFKTDKMYPAPQGGWIGDNYTEYTISVENGLAELPVDPRWIGDGYIKIVLPEGGKDFYYPDCGNFSTKPKELKKSFFTKRHLWVDLHLGHR